MRCGHEDGNIQEEFNHSRSKMRKEKINIGKRSLKDRYIFVYQERGDGGG